MVATATSQPLSDLYNSIAGMGGFRRIFHTAGQGQRTQFNQPQKGSSTRAPALVLWPCVGRALPPPQPRPYLLRRRVGASPRLSQGRPSAAAALSGRSGSRPWPAPRPKPPVQPSPPCRAAPGSESGQVDHTSTVVFTTPIHCPAITSGFDRSGAALNPLLPPPLQWG